MRGKLNKQGHYELFETTKGHQILCLNEQEWYALVKGQQGDLIVHSNADHQKKKTLQQGTFYLADFDNDPEFRDVPHLFLQQGDVYTDMLLPNGLPTSDNHQKKLIRTDEQIDSRTVKEHVEGEGNAGTEKQYQGQAEHLRTKTKEELQRMARKQHITGRSRMSKEELVQKLKEK